MTYRKQRSVESKSFWDYLFFNPRASSSFDTWLMVFESRRLCRQVDKKMRAIMTDAQYAQYKNHNKLEKKTGWVARLLGGGR